MDNRFLENYIRKKEGVSFLPQSINTNFLHFLCLSSSEKEKKQAEVIVKHGCSILYCERFGINKASITSSALETPLFKSCLKKYEAALKLELLSRYGILEPKHSTLDEVLVTGVRMIINPLLKEFIKF